MNARRTTLRWLSLGLLLATALGASAQTTTPVELEFGYRWLSVNGNRDMYKTQINEEQGWLLRNFTLSTTDFDGRATVIDHLRIDSSELGAGPAGMFRLEMGKSDLYNLRLGYRRVEAYSALPAFANPLLSQGITPGQHTYDRTRQMLDVDLELLPWQKMITPFVGYSWNRNAGPGTTTYHVGQDEFLLTQALKDQDTEFRLGAGFNFGPVWGSITQGWRDYRGDEQLSLAPGAGNGNNTAPVLDTPVAATVLTRQSQTDASTPFTNAYVTGKLGDRVKLVGNYVRFNAESNGTEQENATGSFVSFPQSLTYSFLAGNVDSSAQNKTWRGGARAEVAVWDNVDVVAGYQKENRELSGAGLINELLMGAVSFGGVSLGNVRTILSTDNALTRDETVYNLGVSARALGPFAVRAGYAESNMDVTVTPDLEEIVVPGAQGGDFSRRVRMYDLGGSYTQSGLTLLGSYKKDKADEAILRTDYIDRTRYRARASWATAKDLFKVGVTYEQTRQDNTQTGIGYDGTNDQVSGDFELAPVSMFRLRGSYSQFKADSTVSVRNPQNFDIVESAYNQNGKAYEGGVMFVAKNFTLDAAMGQFHNKGDNPFDIDRYRVRAVVNLKAHTGLSAEWARDNYAENGLGLGDYNAERWGLYVRYTP